MSIKIGIQDTPIGFTQNWINYCKKHNIDYKLVDCTKSNIIQQLEDCDALMWHHDLLLIKDNLIAKRLLFALEHSGKVVFPDFFCNWHYDDKVAQKYLLEAINAPVVPTYVFYDKKDALSWIEETDFPKVFKLKGGAGSANVRLVDNKIQATKLVKIAFNKGFSPISKRYYLKEYIRGFRLKKVSTIRFIKNLVLLLKPLKSSFIKQKESNYIYFQDYIPDNKSDFRIVVVNQKMAFGLERYNRENDFRASGSGNFKYLGEHDVESETLKMVFEVTKKLNMNSVAYDIVYDKNKKPLIIEITYAFVSKAYNKCPGYWDNQLVWNGGLLENYQDWMIEQVIKKIKEKQ